MLASKFDAGQVASTGSSKTRRSTGVAAVSLVRRSSVRRYCVGKILAPPAELTAKESVAPPSCASASSTHCGVGSRSLTLLGGAGGGGGERAWAQCPAPFSLVRPAGHGWQRRLWPPQPSPGAYVPASHLTQYSSGMPTPALPSLSSFSYLYSPSGQLPKRGLMGSGSGWSSLDFGCSGSPMGAKRLQCPSPI